MSKGQKKVKGAVKLRRCAKDEGYYKRQFAKTEANKARRAAKRARRKAHWAEVKSSKK